MKGRVATLAMRSRSPPRRRPRTATASTAATGRCARSATSSSSTRRTTPSTTCTGCWERVDGLREADAAHTMQVNQAGTPYECLLQNDVNLTSPPLTATCTNTSPAFSSHFTNAPFTIDDYIKPTDTTCPAPGRLRAQRRAEGQPALPGGCTRDLVHRFYQEQYQLNGGQQNRYTTGSDAVGLTQGVLRHDALPIYKYLHGRGHPRYAIADRFFQAAFGGSFLNHQWLIAAATPTWPGAPRPTCTRWSTPTGCRPAIRSYTPTGPVSDQPLTPGLPGAATGLLCGDFAVNTIQPPYQPFCAGDARRKLPPQTARDDRRPPEPARHQLGLVLGRLVERQRRRRRARLDERAPDTRARTRTRRAARRSRTARTSCSSTTTSRSTTSPRSRRARRSARGTCATRRSSSPARRTRGATASSRRSASSSRSAPRTSTPATRASTRARATSSTCSRAIQGSSCARDTMVVVTYDEFGGQWDHVPPPGQGTTTPGPHDAHGPSTRIPALMLAPGLRARLRRSTTRRTTRRRSLSTIEHRFGLKPLTSRDAAVADLSSVFRQGPPRPRRPSLIAGRERAEPGALPLRQPASAATPPASPRRARRAPLRPGTAAVVAAVDLVVIVTCCARVRRRGRPP